MREFTARCGPIEDALARGDIATALGQLRALAPLEADDRMGTTRLLQLLLAGQSTLLEAQDVAQAALSRWPEYLPGTVALAVVAAERGQAAEAAAFWGEVAELAAAQGKNEDASAAWLAAGRQLAACGQDDQALAALERALVLRPWLRPVARAKVMKRAAEGGWRDILAIIGEEVSLAQPDAGDEVAQVLELVYQGQRENDPVLLGQSVGFLEALLLREEWPADVVPPAVRGGLPAWAGLRGAGRRRGRVPLAGRLYRRGGVRRDRRHGLAGADRAAAAAERRRGSRAGALRLGGRRPDSGRRGREGAASGAGGGALPTRAACARASPRLRRERAPPCRRQRRRAGRARTVGRSSHAWPTPWSPCCDGTWATCAPRKARRCCVP